MIRKISRMIDKLSSCNDVDCILLQKIGRETAKCG